MADVHHLSILETGVNQWNRWRASNPNVLPDLAEARLDGKDLSGGNLRGAILERASLCNTNLRSADLRKANFCEADLKSAYLCQADLTGANLSKANLSLAVLIDANLNETKLDYAKLWGAQTLGWSLKGAMCACVYWDKEANVLVQYGTGEFERIHAEKAIIAMTYEGGITPFEMIALPDITKELSRQHPGCVLRFKSILQGLEDDVVEIAVDKLENVDLEQIKLEWKRKQLHQRKVLGI
jgi:uncharacterized protein YjbI with pentapeptide repeats